jgi:hypothetical protein
MPTPAQLQLLLADPAAFLRAHALKVGRQRA